jgi:hypothetical protein
MPSKQRRGRGVDFQQRFDASRWAEDLVFQSMNEQPDITCVRLGLSGYSADNSVSTVSGEPKVPDLLVLQTEKVPPLTLAMLQAHGFDLSKATSDDFDTDGPWEKLFESAIVAIEVEFSPYRASEMKQRHWKLKTPEAFARRPLKHAKAPVAPNIFVKHEDLGPLVAWQEVSGVPVVVFHVFDQEAFAVSLDDIATFRQSLDDDPNSKVKLAHTIGIFPKDQQYDRSDAQGAGETKLVYMVTPAASRLIGSVDAVTVKAQLGLSSSGKYVSQIVFSGGRLLLAEETIPWLNSLG